MKRIDVSQFCFKNAKKIINNTEITSQIKALAAG